MPVKSKAQLRYIKMLRRKYKDEEHTPEKYKWIWNEEWFPKGYNYKELPDKVNEFISFKEFVKLNEQIDVLDEGLKKNLLTGLLAILSALGIKLAKPSEKIIIPNEKIKMSKLMDKEYEVEKFLRFLNKKFGTAFTIQDVLDRNEDLIKILQKFKKT